MSARRTDMHRLQEVIRLHRLGQSGREIARRLRMGRETVGGYLDAFVKAGLLEGAADDLPQRDVLRAVVGCDSSPPTQQTFVDHAVAGDHREAADQRRRPDDLIASAAMDRLLHHAHVVVMQGHSYRNPPGARKAS